MKIRLIYDDCTPTRERRETEVEDIENDIHIEEFDSETEFAEAILRLTDCEWEDLEDSEADSLFEKAKELMSCNDDPGDGSANFLYLSVDGNEDNSVTYTYDCLDDLDLENCSEQEVKKAIIKVL